MKVKRCISCILVLYNKSRKTSCCINYRAIFHLVSKGISHSVWFCSALLSDSLTEFAPLSQPMRTETNREFAANTPFSRAWRQLHVFASNSDWFFVCPLLCLAGVIGHFRVNVNLTMKARLSAKPFT